MANSDMLVRIKANTDNYNAGIARAKRTLEGFKQENLTLGGILNQSTKSIVAAAAQYASFAAVLGTVASGFAEAASKGIEMSREAEGVEAAFKRLNQPGLLENLRQATHNTVNDLELMKQAVKFDNFNLSLEQMGSFLAFAQQQAKDTGQDVNTLVDSIVLGLGRKSLPILDNLGISAEEIRNRMKETGDMTKAVADIIEERMAAAGDYVETAAERAAQGQTALENAMKRLGDTMNSLTGAGATLWTDLKIGAVDLANTAIKPLISLFNQLASYVQGTSAEDILTRGMTDVTDTVDDNGRLIRKDAIASIPEIIVSGTAPKKTRGSGGGGGRSRGGKGFDISSIAFDANKAMLAAVKGTDDGPSEVWKAITQGAQESTTEVERLTAALEKLNEVEGVTTGEAVKDSSNMADKWQQAGTAISAVGSAMSSIEDPAAKVASTIAQAIATLALTYAQSLKGTFTPWDWIAAAIGGVATLVSVISTVHSATGYAQGGIVKGNSYSGDNIYGGPDAMVNAGELVLTKAQQGNLASQLQGNGINNMNISGRIKGTDIILSVDRSLQLQGKQLLTWG